MKRNILLALILTLAISARALPADDAGKSELWSWMDANSSEAADCALDIWSTPELGEQEFESSKRLADYLEANGFAIEWGVADLPTAFVATYTRGEGPVIGYLCEYDALPGLSQEAMNPVHTPVEEAGPGHGCGHNLLGAGSAFAGVGLKKYMEDNGLEGTIKVFGAPAEETLVGKVYMTRDGVFEGVDAMLGWHPGGSSGVSYRSSLAMTSIKFRFFGKTAHGAGDPHHGRSSLDAVELMDAGVNFMREHVIDKARIHYVITNGGGAPNVVPDVAEVWYFVRAPKTEQQRPILEWVREIAEAAARMTKTELEEELLSSCYEFLPNEPISRVMDRNFRMVGPPEFDEQEYEFARNLAESFDEEPDSVLINNELDTLEVVPYDEIVHGSGSVDDGDVSWTVPYARLTATCTVSGTPGHSWQVVACTGSSIGTKGMIVAGKVMAGAGADLLGDHSLIEAAKKDLREKLGDRTYECGVPDSLPPPSRR